MEIEIDQCPTPYCERKKPPKMHRKDSEKMIPISKFKITCHSCGLSSPWNEKYMSSREGRELAAAVWNQMGWDIIEREHIRKVDRMLAGTTDHEY